MNIVSQKCLVCHLFLLYGVFWVVGGGLSYVIFKHLSGIVFHTVETKVFA